MSGTSPRFRACSQNAHTPFPFSYCSSWRSQQSRWLPQTTLPSPTASAWPTRDPPRRHRCSFMGRGFTSRCAPQLSASRPPAAPASSANERKPSQPSRLASQWPPLKPSPPASRAATQPSFRVMAAIAGSISSRLKLGPLLVAVATPLRHRRTSRTTAQLFSTHNPALVLGRSAARPRGKRVERPPSGTFEPSPARTLEAASMRVPDGGCPTLFLRLLA
jgi:hypothetical protein